MKKLLKPHLLVLRADALIDEKDPAKRKVLGRAGERNRGFSHIVLGRRQSFTAAKPEERLCRLLSRYRQGNRGFAKGAFGCAAANMPMRARASRAMVDGIRMVKRYKSAACGGSREVLIVHIH